MAGANDLMDRAAAGEDFDAIIADIAEAGSDNITTLGALGVRTVLMAEVRPIKFAPLVRDDAEAQAAFAEAVDAANIALFDAAVAAADAAGVNLVTVRDEAFLTYIGITPQHWTSMRWIASVILKTPTRSARPIWRGRTAICSSMICTSPKPVSF